jgi:site-specific DNA recombinase
LSLPVGRIGAVTTAIIYCRVSDDQAGTSRSVEQQEAACREHCAEAGWDVAEVIVDSDISASRYSRKRRPGWARVLELIGAGAVDALVAWDLDRMLRQPKELEHLIDLADKGLPVRTLGGGDVQLATSDGRFVARILTAKAAKESDDISRRVRRAKAAKAARGEPARLHSPMAFGWRDGVTPEPGEADLIVRSARRLLDGEVGVTALAREWTEAGWRRPRSGAAWSATSVRAVMESPRNAGLRQHRGEVIGEGNWPAILDRATYERLGAMFADPDRRRTARRVTTFTGIYRCYACGSTLAYTSIEGRRMRVCKPHSHQPRCAKVGITAPLADPAVLRAVLEVVDHGSSGTVNAEAATPFSAEELADVEQRLVDVAEDFAAGRVHRAQFLAATETLTSRRDELLAMVRPNTPSAAAPFLGRAGALAAAWGGMGEFQRNAVLRSVLDAVVVGPRIVGGGRWDPDRLSFRWRI